MGDESSKKLGKETLHARCWLIDDGRPGHFRQQQALAAALGLGAVSTSLSLSQVPVLEGLRHCDSKLILTCGRRGAGALGRLRGNGHWPRIQLLHPAAKSQGFDWLLLPRHDQLGGSNVLTFTGALSAVDDAWLLQARQLSPHWDRLPRPLTAMLLGGPHRNLPWGRRQLLRWVTDAVAEADAARGSLVIAASRRTPAWVQPLLQALPQAASIRFLPGNAPGREYHGLIAWADQFCVSGDSISMLAEAVATPQPVRVLGLAGLRGKHRRYSQQLQQLGRFVISGKNLQPIRDTETIAMELKRRGALLGLGKELLPD